MQDGVLVRAVQAEGRNGHVERFAGPGRDQGEIHEKFTPARGVSPQPDRPEGVADPERLEYPPGGADLRGLRQRDAVPPGDPPGRGAEARHRRHGARRALENPKALNGCWLEGTLDVRCVPLRAV